jgi:WD repeat-containing protein 35
MVECFSVLQDFANLEALIQSVPEKDPLLNTMAEELRFFGHVHAAVNAYLKYGDIQAALDTCIELHHVREKFNLLG